MFQPSQRRHTAHPRTTRRPRRGVALVFVMVFVIAMAALAMSSIFMSSGSTLLAKSYDRERDLRYAAEEALAIGKSRINANPGLLVLPAGQDYKQILSNAPLLGADNQPLPGVHANVYIGLTGSTSGQNGRFASIIAQAVDEGTNASFIRRLELTQESFAKFAYWSNSETNNGTTIFFNNGDQLWGPVWSNDVISIGSGGATFNAEVGTAQTIQGKQYGTFVVPPLENQKKINLPSTDVLGVLASYASVGGMTVSSADAASSNETLVRDRIEFLAFDVDGKHDSTSTDEGFYRWYQGNTGQEQAVRGDWVGPRDGYGNPTKIPQPSAVNFCGDWHYMPVANGTDVALKFYPASVHGQTWFKNQIDSALVARPNLIPAGYASHSAYVTHEVNLPLDSILTHQGARCFLAGDPHLVAVDRPLNGVRPDGLTWGPRDINKGGDDTTFTGKGNYGQWIAPANAPPAPILTLRKWDGRYLYAIGHTYNPNGKGVIFASGNVGISGVVNGLVTLYAKGDIVILDDVRYANDPVLGVCHDILGLISDFDVVVADNALNTPVPLELSASLNYGFRSMDDTPDLYVHAVSMSLASSFRVENWGTGPQRGRTCGGVVNGRGCIDLSGGIIQVTRGAVGSSTGYGFAKRYTYDRCSVRNPPPYFPTTGRFIDNRYLELDPVGFKPDVYFKSLIPN